MVGLSRHSSLGGSSRDRERRVGGAAPRLFDSPWTRLGKLLYNASAVASPPPPLASVVSFLGVPQLSPRSLALLMLLSSSYFLSSEPHPRASPPPAPASSEDAFRRH